jgi:broad specificity phosphatase PhoE
VSVSSVLLIRHGQASFNGPQYDVLSDTGRAQGRHLGRYLATRTDRPVEVVFTGSLARQRDTAAAMQEGAREAGSDLPTAELLEGLDEYPAITLLKRGLPMLCESDAELRAVVGDPLAQGGGLAGIPQFDRVFRRVQLAWMTAELVLDDVESFADFRARVCGALSDIAERAGEGRAAVVTSGGPVGMAMQLALDLSDHKAMRVSEVVANTGLTSMKRAHGEWLVTSFNALPHLSDPALITYR